MSEATPPLTLMASYPNGPGQAYPGHPPGPGYTGYPAGPGYPVGFPQQKSKTPLLIASVVAALAVLGAAVVMLMPGDAEASEVFLVPAASAGPDPFSASPFAPPPDPALAQPANANATPPPASGSPNQTASGAKPGLYGGTNDKKSCDPAAMVTFLGANPDKAQAWVDALTADPTVRLRDGQPLTVQYIPHYVAGLTPITLMEDTAVTNHGFKNGRQTVLQSVLQKGSAVLIDEFGVPRVKCYCGNPLLPPVASSVPPVYSGPPWPDFDPKEIIVITPPPEPIVALIVVVPNNPGEMLEIPPGSGDPGLDVYMVGGPPPINPDFPNADAPPPPTSSAPPPRATAPPPRAPAVDPNDCSDGSCLDDIEEFDAIEEAYREQEASEECVLYDEEAGRGFRVSCDTPGAQRL